MSNLIQIEIDPRHLKDIIFILRDHGWNEGWFPEKTETYRRLRDYLEEWRGGVGYPDE